MVGWGWLCGELRGRAWGKGHIGWYGKQMGDHEIIKHILDVEVLTLTLLEVWQFLTEQGLLTNLSNVHEDTINDNLPFQVYTMQTAYISNPLSSSNKNFDASQKVHIISKPNRLSLIHNNPPLQALYKNEKTTNMHVYQNTHTSNTYSTPPSTLLKNSLTLATSTSSPPSLSTAILNPSTISSTLLSSTPVHKLTTFLNCASSSED